jgi:hypothetical protein
MKQSIFFTLCIFLLLSIASARAEDGNGDNNGTPESGIENTTPFWWTLSSGNDTLTIGGTEAMPNYLYADEAPWSNYSSSITAVIINDSVTSIGNSAFADCKKLVSVHIGIRVDSIGDGAFSYCSILDSINIPDNVRFIGYGVFEGCTMLTKAIAGNNVDSIGKAAFFACSSLQSFRIPDKVKHISDRTFSECGLLSITIPPGIISIGLQAFSECESLTDLVIPDNVECIGERAFAACTGLISLTIGSRVVSIGEGAFGDCYNLESITNRNPVPQAITKDVFYDTTYDNATLYASSAYGNVDVWREFRYFHPNNPTGIELPVSESFRNDISGQIQVIVTNISGQTVWQQTVNSNENISLEHLPQGIYLVTVNGKTRKVPIPYHGSGY